MASGCRIFTVTGTFDKCSDTFCLFCFHAHDASDLLCHGSTAYGTAVYRRLLMKNGGSHGITSGESAGAAVVARQTLTDRCLSLIYFNFKYIAKNS